MAHSVEIPYLDKENIEIYLNDLATEIEKAKIGKHSILIVGGAAMAVVNGRFCPKSVRSFCPIVAGFNAGTYKVPACVL